LELVKRVGGLAFVHGEAVEFKILFFESFINVCKIYLVEVLSEDLIKLSEG